MKRKMFILLGFLALILSACGTNEMKSDNNVSYSISDLKADFVREFHISETNTWDYSVDFDAAKALYPICEQGVNQANEKYTIYTVAEGGKYYVLWTEDGDVLSTRYIDRLRAKSDFEKIAIGSSLDDVLKIDHTVVLEVFSSKNPCTKSYLNDGTMIVYTYLYDGDKYEVEEMQIQPVNDEWINMDDLP